MAIGESFVGNHPHISGLVVMIVFIGVFFSLPSVGSVVALSFQEMLWIFGAVGVGLLVVGAGIATYYHGWGRRFGWWLVGIGAGMILIATFGLALGGGPSCPPGSSTRVCV